MTDVDVVIIGAGYAGMYQLYKLRNLGMKARVIEAGDDVGGTWYWNRYPGARCDIESIHYSYSFDDELQQEWNWSERYAAQPELLKYAQHVADRFDLRKDITFNTRVAKLDFDDAASTWTATMDDGSQLTCRYVVAATGCLSAPSHPTFEGMEDFAGEHYYTSSWPHEGVDLTGKKVAVIGTGSSGLQTITTIAPQVAELTVFQRTPSFAVPAHNHPWTEEDLEKVKINYPEFRERDRNTRIGFYTRAGSALMSEATPEQIQADLDERWEEGGLGFNSGFADTLIDPDSNYRVAEYVRTKIREKVKDPVTAERLSPRTYPIASKRMCVDTGYFEVYNQDNVTLVDINEEPIKRITRDGIVAGDTEHKVDVIIFATGFDAMTGALDRIDISAGGQLLRDKWKHGPRTYLGLMSAGFPNLFTITGPGSPSVLSNMMVSIEYHVDWVTNAIAYLSDHGLTRMEATEEAEDNWVTTVNDFGNMTLMPQANSWYMGANIPGKERVFMPFVGGVDTYAQVGNGVATVGYHGFDLA